MNFLKNVKSGVKGLFALPQGMVFATRAVTKFESNHPEILKNLQNLTLTKEPAELVREVARIIVLEGLNGQAPGVRQLMSDPQVIDHMVKETIGSIQVGFIKKYRSDKLQEKYFAAGIKDSNVDFIDQIDPSTLKKFHIIDGIGDYTQTKNLIHDVASAVVLALSEEKILKSLFFLFNRDMHIHSVYITFVFEV
jgi:hypothetical protein